MRARARLRGGRIHRALAAGFAAPGVHRGTVTLRVEGVTGVEAGMLEDMEMNEACTLASGAAAAGTRADDE